MEMLIVVAIVGMLVAITLPKFSDMKENQALKNTVGEITSALHKAQSQSLASVDSSEYGVHFQSDKIIIFTGTIFSAGATDNKIINVISPANISNVTLGGVSSSTGELYFERLSGAPNKNGAITVSVYSVSKVVTISATGAVGVN